MNHVGKIHSKQLHAILLKTGKSIYFLFWHSPKTYTSNVAVYACNSFRILQLQLKHVYLL